MTRYARALGSKACNAKVPEPSTPWCNLALKNATTQWSDSVEEESLEKKSPVVKLKKKVVKLNAPKVLTASKLGLKAPVKVPTPRKVEEKEIDDTVSTAMKGNMNVIVVMFIQAGLRATRLMSLRAMSNWFAYYIELVSRSWGQRCSH